MRVLEVATHDILEVHGIVSNPRSLKLLFCQSRVVLLQMICCVLRCNLRG